MQERQRSWSLPWQGRGVGSGRRTSSRCFAALLVALAAGSLVVLGPGAATPALAKSCTYCRNEIEDSVNELKCPHCIKITEKIKQTNQKVWVLAFREGRLQRVEIKRDTGNTEAYWYLPYRLKNTDKVPHDFFIEITATTDRGIRRVHYRDGYRPDVYEQVRRRMGLKEEQRLLHKLDVGFRPKDKKNKPPAVEDKTPSKKETAEIALPTIKPDEELDCVAIFGPFNLEMNELVISVRGLTNSSLRARMLPPVEVRDGDAVYKVQQDDDYVVVEGKPFRRAIKEAVLQLHYRRPGDEFNKPQVPITFVARRWVDVKREVQSDLEANKESGWLRYDNAFEELEGSGTPPPGGGGGGGGDE